MSALYKSIDEQLSELRAQHESDMQACKDRTLAAEVESALLKEQIVLCNEARAVAERVTTKLLTQFGLVARVFEEARIMALEVEQANQPEKEGVGTEVPTNLFANQGGAS